MLRTMMLAALLGGPWAMPAGADVWTFYKQNTLVRFTWDHVGLSRQSGQFLLMIFFAACNSGLLWRARFGDAKRLGSRPVVLLCAPVIAVVLGGYAWGWLREHDPRHIEAHVQIAQLAVAAGESEIAEEQHRLAMAEGWNAQEGHSMR